MGVAMTQDEIIHMAPEAGLQEVVWQSKDSGQMIVKDMNVPALERFAALVAETTGIEQQREIIRLKAIIEEQANGAQNLVLAEREACAKVCEEHGFYGVAPARDIRARGEK